MILRTDGLEVGYKKRTVVRDIDLQVFRGQFVGLLGPNGCGKSTILRTLLRMLAPLGGVVFLDGQELHRLHQDDLARKQAAVLTEPLSPALLTAFDIASMGRYPHTGLFGRLGEDDIQKTWEALQMVNAADLAPRYFGELSDGEKQKVLVARALAQEPELIVMDEPTSHLDARHRIEVMLIMRRLVQEKGVTIVASLHDIDLAMKMCDVVILTKNGRILAYGPPEDVLSEERVAELYDLTKACFSSSLGGIELRSGNGEPVFVVAGSGSGAQLYRALAKHGFEILTGVLSQNDFDFHLARAVGATIVAEGPYQEVSLQSYDQAVVLMERVHHVVDAGFPVAHSNRRNVGLVLQALEKRRTAWTLRSQEEARDLYGDHLGRSIHCQSISALLMGLRDGRVQQG